MSEAPQRIGRYVVQSVIGRGAMGVIYKAHDPAIDRLVAIKLVRADLLSGDDREDYLERFRREAQAAGRCMHPNIVAIHDFALHDGNPYIAMEFVQGISLSDALARGTKFLPADAIYIVCQLLEALECAHGLGIVHRDVKPANILLLPDGRVKVTDFGISRIESSHLTHSGSVIGTPSYMSPEQCRGDPVDRRSDLFSAGVVLYELITGERPFPGKSFTEVFRQVLEGQPRDIREKVPAVPASLQAALSRAMAKDPADRYPTAQAMADALRDAMRADATATVVGPTANVVTDGTIVQVPAGVGQNEAGLPNFDAPHFDSTMLDSIERKLARHVGPIAKRLVDTASRRANTVESLCETLARSIERPQERAAFLNDALGVARSQLGGSGTRIGSGINSAIPADQVERVQRDLTKVVGPIARVLVKRALGSAASAQALREALAGHIEKPADRAAFLKGN